MSSTTLVTFLLQAPLSTLSVNLLGSWDNFKKAYPMQKDSRTGRGHWRGCHSFQNIICDGDSLNTTGSRNGGLKMGGKYWYYYQLDDDIDYHNPVEPFTTFCPLLPGQAVNVLEVPIEWKPTPEHHSSRSRSSSSAASFICTLDPEDRYLKPRAPPEAGLPCRATPTSVSTIGKHIIRKPVPNKAPLLHGNRLIGRMSLDTPQRSPRASNVEEILADNKSFSVSESRSGSFWTAIHPYRGIRSAFTSHGLGFRWRAATDRHRLRPHTSPTVGTSRAQGTGSFAPASGPYVSTGAEELVPSLNDLKPPPDETALAPTSAHKTGAEASEAKGVANSAKADVPALDDMIASRGHSVDRPHEQLSSSAGWEPLGHPAIGKNDIGAFLTRALSQLQLSHPRTTNDTQESKFGAHSGPATSAAQSNLETPTILCRLPNAAAHDVHSGDVATKLYRSSSSQYTMNDLFSPSLSTASAFTGPMSPYHLSQPGTPLLNDFGDDDLGARPSGVWSSPMPGGGEGIPSSMSPYIKAAPPMSHVANSDNGTFNGYSLAREDHTSSLKMLESPSRTRTPGYPLEPTTGKQLVESWNDGSEQRTTGMKELLEDLGYLGGMIA